MASHLVRTLRTIAAAAAVLLVASACAGSASSGPATALSPEATAALSKADQFVNQFSAQLSSVNAPASAPPIAPGKLIVTIPCSYAAEGCRRVVDGFATAAHTVGWRTMMIDPAGDADKVRSAVETAIRLKADGILFGAAIPGQLTQVLSEARNAGIALVNTEEPPSPVFDANVTTDHLAAGRAQAAYLAKATNGHGKVLLVNDPEYPSVEQWHQGVLGGLKEFCPQCTVTADINFQIADLATGLPTQFQAALAAHPDTNTVWAGYDAAAVQIIPVIQRNPNGEHIQLVSANGDAANLGFIRGGKVQTATIGVPIEWQGYAALDVLNRMFNNVPYGKTVNVGQKLITKGNLPTAIPWNGDVDWQGTYLRLWNKAS
jgi:ribose transport system substrate-binding protein